MAPKLRKANKLPLKKILIAGLQKSGKTSIILSLQGKSNLMSYFSLRPTPGLEIKELESSQFHYILWELGGQQYYRQKYLDNFADYTQDAIKLIFVIDIQEKSNYPEAIGYLKEIVAKFDELGDYPLISIFLHKFDPEIRSLPEYSDQKIEKELINPLKNIIPSTFKHEIFRTTIFTVFHKDPF